MRPVSQRVKHETCFLSVRILRQQILGLLLRQAHRALAQGVRVQGVRVRRAERAHEQQADLRAEGRQRGHPHQRGKEFVTSPVSLKLPHLQPPVPQMRSVQRGVARSVADHSRAERVSRRALPHLVVEHL